MATGFVGIYTFELLLPESHSLKEKRMVLRSVKAQLVNRVSCSIAEVDRLLDTAERWLLTQDFELIAHERDLVSLDD